MSSYDFIKPKQDTELRVSISDTFAKLYPNLGP